MSLSLDRSLEKTGRKTKYVYNADHHSCNRSAHFVFAKLRATDSIVNTDKGTRVFYSCDRLY